MTGLIAHLLQSTIFALLASLLTLAFRHYDARTRFWIWFAASVKFLLPFSILFNFGGSFGANLWPRHSASFLWLEEFVPGQPGHLLPAPGSIAHVSHSEPLQSLFIAVWLIGLILALARWRLAWNRSKNLVCTAKVVTSGLEYDVLRHLRSSAHVRTPVKLMTTACAIDPCVFGLWRSALILPEAILPQLGRAELEAIIAHELAHVRRRDNLLAAFQMTVQAVFWFHPLVWWLGDRLLDERERACDEDVLRRGADPLAYAQGILRVCKLCLSSSMACAAGVTGAVTRKRLARIVAGEIGAGLNRGGKAVLLAAALATVVGPILAGLVFAPRINAQASPASANLPAFEVASIKPSDADSHLNIIFAPGGRLVVTHATLRFLMKIAYDLTDDQILGGPEWLSSRRFDVEGKPATSLGGDPQFMSDRERGLFHEKIRLRLQRLLAERFRLDFRSESKAMPVFALVEGKGGLKMKRSSGPGDPDMSYGHGILKATRWDMATLARFLAEGQVGRPVIEMTGVTDRFDFTLQFSPDATLNPLTPDTPGNQSAPDSGGMSIFTALQQQLGLRLEARTSPANYVVVTRAELPGEN